MAATPDRKIRTLAICYYVYAAVTAAIGLAVCLLLVAMFPSSFGLGKPPLQTPEQQLQMDATTHMAFGLVAFFVVAQAALYAWAARLLNRHRGRTFALVLGCLALTSIPIGTALGVFTLIVLTDDLVRAKFASTDSPPTGG
jgi:MFS family permease